MKKETYNVRAACTENKLIACECECMSGGERKECVTCIHCLPLNTQVTLLLMGRLAEHMLLELSSQWNEQLQNDLQEMGALDSVRQSIITLVMAAKEQHEDM
eukprot:4470647-Ditylum_brightwellii.AAC.1